MAGSIPPDALNTFSRTIAVGIFMLIPGAIGYYLDQWWGTNYLTMIGFIFGMIAGIGILLIQSKAMDLERKAAAKRKDDDRESN